MLLNARPPKFDLEDRALQFAKAVRDFVKKLPPARANVIYGDQLLRSSSSVGANYIEGNDALGQKDFLMKLKTSRSEAKEGVYWLRLIEIGSSVDQQQMHAKLVDECGQFVRIFSAIIRNACVHKAKN